MGNSSDIVIGMQPRIKLEPIALTDADWMYRLRSDPEVNRYIESPRPDSLEKMEETLRRIIEVNALERWNFLKILRADDRQPLGTICLWNYNEARTKAEFGFELFPMEQGKGIMSEALSLLLEFARREEQLKRVEAWTHRDNAAARRLLERHGFVRDLAEEEKAKTDGTLKSYVIYGLRLVPFVHPRSVETARLTQVPFVERDAPFILQLLNTEGWKRYIGDRGVTDEASAIAYLQGSPMRLEREQGMTFYKVCRKDDGSPIGMCGLILRDYLPGPDLGFAFLPEAEGKGYAREAAEAWIPLVKSVFGYDTLYAITVPENERSIGLLKRLSFEQQEMIEREGEKLMVWRRRVVRSEQ